MSYLKFKKTDIIPSQYLVYPSYNLGMSASIQASASYISKYFFINEENSSSIGQQRKFYDIKGNFVTASYNLSGAVVIEVNNILTSRDKTVINQMRNIYASGTFKKPYNYTSSSVWLSASRPSSQYVTILNIPSVLYGTEVKPGSFKIALSGANAPVLTDDGYGGVFSSSVLVGFILYQHGLVCFSHKMQIHEQQFSCSVLYFSGTSHMPVTMYRCIAPKGLMNFSNNSSYTVYNTASNRYEITTDKPKTFITTVGLYDENFELIGIAKTAKPLLHEENTGIEFRLKLNY